jgi:uncharacterized protein YggE
MVRNLVIGIAVIGVGLTPRVSGAQAAPMPPQVVVSGTGEARVTPDRATITVGVQSRAQTAAAAAADNARRQKAILDTLKALGLPSEQLSTENFNVSPEMTYPQGGSPRVVAYVVTNTVRADVRKLDDVARVIDAALAKGANEISSLQFYSSKADSARRAALAAAVADARADAEVLAKAAGGTLGPLLELSTSESPVRPMPVMMRAMAAAPMPKTPIEPGQQTITATVSARWTLEGGGRR